MSIPAPVSHIHSSSLSPTPPSPQNCRFCMPCLHEQDIVNCSVSPHSLQARHFHPGSSDSVARISTRHVTLTARTTLLTPPPLRVHILSRASKVSHCSLTFSHQNPFASKMPSNQGSHFEGFRSKEPHSSDSPASAYSDEEHMSVGRYCATRFSSLKPQMRPIANPFKTLALLNLQQWLFFLVAFFAWTWDAFDFFTVSLVVGDLAETFGKTNADITWGITLVLMLRSVGAITFGLAADRYGRKW